MTPEKQRIAIGEFCGLLLYLHDLPDYLNDLNAMHEAEKNLSPPQRCRYDANLHGAKRQQCGPVWDATAAQRAESFLKTVGKWED